MAGTINLALTQQFDMDGSPLSGGLLYFFVAGTSTPQNAYQDQALTIVYPNPIVLDASGRVPMFYLADGSIKIRLLSKTGTVIIAADQLLVIGPSTGASTAPGVDPTTVLQTGDIKARFGTGTLDGFVRCNGNTIGNTGSTASELAAPAAHFLFVYLWGTNVLPLFTSAGGAATRTDAESDWTALKKIQLPDIRGRAIAGLDDMGGGAAGRLTAAFWGANATILGNAGGAENHLLVALETPLPVHAHGITDGVGGLGHAHSITQTTHSHSVIEPNNAGNIGHAHSVNSDATALASGGAADKLLNKATTGLNNVSTQFATTGITIGGQNANISIDKATTGITISNTPATPATNSHAIASPSIAMTFYMKL
jgi:hypothetical protein